MERIIRSRGVEIVTLIDEDMAPVFDSVKWYIDRYGYVANSKLGTLHRVVMEKPVGLTVDHINRDKLDNRRQNLRTATNSQNSANNKWPGVFYDEHSTTNNKWRGAVRKEGKTVYTKRCPSREEALALRKALAIEIHGEFAGVHNE
jgi:hypothetical protein